MVEILIGLVVITLVLVVSLTAMTHATKVSRVARNRLEASKYVELVIEQYRNNRDLNKEAFFTNKTCLNPCGSFGVDSAYVCTMSCSFTPALNPNRVDATITMTWNDSGKSLTVVQPTILTENDQ